MIMSTSLYAQQLLTDLANAEISVPSVPTHFGVLLRLRSAINDAHAPFRKVIDVINGEPVIAAKVIQTANTAAARSQDPILDVERAVFRLGLETVKRVTLAVSMVQLANAKELVVFSGISRGMWLNSLYASAASATIARDLAGPKPDEAAFYGLLSNLGGFYLLYLASKHDALTQSQTDVRAVAAEYNHDLTLDMIRFLGLPKEVEDALNTQSLEGRYINSPPENITHTVHVSRILADDRFTWKGNKVQLDYVDQPYLDLKEWVDGRYEALKAEYV